MRVSGEGSERDDMNRGAVANDNGIAPTDRIAKRAIILVQGDDEKRCARARNEDIHRRVARWRTDGDRTYTTPRAVDGRRECGDVHHTLKRKCITSPSLTT